MLVARIRRISSRSKGSVRVHWPSVRIRGEGMKIGMEPIKGGGEVRQFRRPGESESRMDRRTDMRMGGRRPSPLLGYS